MDKSQNAVHIFNKLAQVYQEKYMNVLQYHESLNLFCESLPSKNATILDVACGPGNVAQYLLQQLPLLQITGIDLAPNMLELARSNNPTATFLGMDCRDIALLERKFDAIVCSFALPYLTKEESIKFIADATELLTPNGIIYISTMEDSYNKSGLQRSSSGDAMYIHYHEATYLMQALQENGCTVSDIRRQNFLHDNGTGYTDIIIIAKKA